jgi:hypothetical protein
MKTTVCIFVLSVNTLCFGLNNYVIEDYKLVPDSMDLFSSGTELFKKYNLKIPAKASCANQGWIALRKPISNEVEINKTKRIEIGNQMVKESYEINKDGRKILDFTGEDYVTDNFIKTQFSWDNMWVVEFRDNIILNGIDLNKAKGYSKSFCFNFEWEAM